MFSVCFSSVASTTVDRKSYSFYKSLVIRNVLNLQKVKNAMPATRSTNGFGDYEFQPPPRPTRNVKGMECLIPVINKLRDVFDRTGGSSSAIQLPQIVVLGSQVISVVTALHNSFLTIKCLFTLAIQLGCYRAQGRAVYSKA